MHYQSNLMMSLITELQILALKWVSIIFLAISFSNIIIITFYVSIMKAT